MTLFKQTGGTYRQKGDYLLLNLELTTANDTREIGVWGQRHRSYLKSYHRVLYYNYLTSGKLNSYLADVDEQAEEMFSRLVKELSGYDEADLIISEYINFYNDYRIQTKS